MAILNVIPGHILPGQLIQGKGRDLCVMTAMHKSHMKYTVYMVAGVCRRLEPTIKIDGG